MIYNEKEYSTKPDINGNRYSIIFIPAAKWFMRGINISVHKPDKYCSRKEINKYADFLLKKGYFETNRQIKG